MFRLLNVGRQVCESAKAFWGSFRIWQRKIVWAVIVREAGTLESLYWLTWHVPCSWLVLVFDRGMRRHVVDRWVILLMKKEHNYAYIITYHHRASSSHHHTSSHDITSHYPTITHQIISRSCIRRRASPALNQKGHPSLNHQTAPLTHLGRQHNTRCQPVTRREIFW